MISRQQHEGRGKCMLLLPRWGAMKRQLHQASPSASPILQIFSPSPWSTSQAQDSRDCRSSRTETGRCVQQSHQTLGFPVPREEAQLPPSAQQLRAELLTWQ